MVFHRDSVSLTLSQSKSLRFVEAFNHFTWNQHSCTFALSCWIILYFKLKQVFTQSFHPPRRVKSTQMYLDKPIEVPLRNLSWWWTCPTTQKDGQFASCPLARIRLPFSSFNILLAEWIFSYLWGQHALMSLTDPLSRSAHCPTMPSKRSDVLVIVAE